MRIHRPVALVAALLALGACRDLPTASTPAPAEPAPAAQERTPVRCAVTVASRSVACAAPVAPRGMRRNIILGGQGLNVRLVSSNVSFDGGDHVFSFDVTVQNLLDQPMGTDGTTPTGVRIFFNSGPTATGGSGEITVLTDSIGTFLAANQPYYKYDGAIQPRGVSQPQRWEFSVDAGVTDFEFIVYVDAQLPAETGVLHWRPERGTQLYLADLRGVWAGSAHDVFAVSDGAVLHFDGNYWRAMDVGGCGCEDAFYGVWGSGGDDVYAVGLTGKVMHWTGDGWTEESDPDLGSDDLYGAWGSSASDVWAVGDFGRIVHFDGGDWTTVAANPVTTEPLYAVWGSGSGSAWAVGGEGTILHWDGAEWTPQSLPDPVTLTAVWGTSASDVWAAGFTDGCGCGGDDGVLYHYDGADWTAVAGTPDLTDLPFYGGWSNGSGDVWITTLGGILHFDGVDWTQDAVGVGAPLYGITGTAGGSVFAVGSLATIARNTGSGWETMALPDADVHGLWGSSASDVWAVGDVLIRHRTGAGWSWEVSPDALLLNAVWGSGASDVWAVGFGGAVVHYDGAAWSAVTVSGSVSTLNAVWGASSADAWAAGEDGAVLHWDGSDWTVGTVGAGRWSGVWGSSASDVFLVGEGGEIQRWSGSAWAPMSSGTTSHLRGVWGSGPGDVYAVGDGTVLHYDGNPEGDWTTLSTPANPLAPVNGVWGSGANDVYLLANHGLDLVRWDGSSWRTVSSFSANADIRMYAIWGSGNRNLYTGGDLGTILHGER